MENSIIFKILKTKLFIYLFIYYLLLFLLNNMNSMTFEIFC
jgi:hypothetical protein